ncbi:MAG: transketolase family protein [Actinobacteria bacterium]|nr:transketolase family protein [Actinomycetota bacterium]
MKYDLTAVANTYSKTLVELASADSDIFVLEADLMKASGTKVFKDSFPDRHINVGIAEQNLVGVAAGIASMGRIPFAFAMANFMSQRAADQVTISAAYNKFNVKLIGGFAGLSQEKNGGTHISIMDMAVMRNLPNMKVIAPSDLSELSQVLKFAAGDVGPTYIRLSRYLPQNLFGASYKFELSKAYQIGSGNDLTIISTGITTCIAMEALKLLESEGIASRLLHVPTIKPADEESIVRCAKQTNTIITIEDHSTCGGLGGMVAEIISENYSARLHRIGLDNSFGITADLEYQLKYFGISVENIIDKSKKILKIK